MFKRILITAAITGLIAVALSVGASAQTGEIVPVLHQDAAGLPAFIRLVARQEVANLVFSHKFQCRHS